MSNPIVFILNGPNLNLLGEREPEIYGHTTLAEIEERSRRRAEGCGLATDFRQTNFEGVLIESVHEARKKAAGVIINPAGLTFTSVSLLDSLKMFDGP
jgi:3-dehydroquinate dehydratase-2